MSYGALWQTWRAAAPDWLAGHLDALEARYLIRI